MGEANKILIAVNGSEISLRAVTYVGKLLGRYGNIEICLLYVVPPPPPYYYLEGGSYADYVREEEAGAEKVFLPATDLLVGAGIDRQNISFRTHVSIRSETISEVILAVQKEGVFGTVVVGKRGIDKTEEFLFGSISNAIAHQCSSFTLWVVA